MGGILSSLNTSYTGLQAHQSMVDVTGNNISNASDEFYSRQRVIAKPQAAYMYGTKNVNMGVDVPKSSLTLLSRLIKASLYA